MYTAQRLQLAGDRNKLVYETFIRYIPGDKEYELVIPANDLAWISKRAGLTT